MNGFRTDEALRDNRIAVGESFPRLTAIRSRILATSPQLLFLLFLFTLPLVNPWVRGDGVGYYAYLRSALIDHDLRFENDYLQANESFVQAHTDAQGRLLPQIYTPTGYVENHFTVGPALLWAPVMVTVHGVVTLAQRFGSHVPADGYSRPYLLAMALTTACYGFLSLLLSFQIARKYFDEQWVFLSTLGIWLASSLPVYMYFNPSWSHAMSAFSVSLYLWYWERTRGRRTAGQWAILGLLAGLMGNVYYPNAIFLVFPAVETIYPFVAKSDSRVERAVPIPTIALDGAVCLLTFLVALLPTFITRRIIYGSPFETGYPHMMKWYWTSPVLLKVLFSSDHGMFSWTPILILAVVGLVFVMKRDPMLGTACIVTFLAFYYFIASYPDWDGISSFGNRFFISLTPIFILGLAALIDRLSAWLGQPRRALAAASLALALLITWNVGLIFQWGTHMVPARGEVSWSRLIHNQFVEVPQRVTQAVGTYFSRRGEMMKHIEEQDLEQMKTEQRPGE